ncbi:DUF2000 family protein [Desertibaculum subflavum]|uniref:DUF2000 family protein n=1 Tax=Desertibaculum subflavum TaxID=2268458 RepID=UPI000E665B06
MFDTKIAILIRDDLAAWQKLNVTAFLASGIAALRPDCIGAPYVDAAGRQHAPMLGQPVLVFAATLQDLRDAHAVAMEKELAVAGYVEAMFRTGHDAANRAAFAEADPAATDWAGLALHGPKRAVDKAVKGLALHA